LIGKQQIEMFNECNARQVSVALYQIVKYMPINEEMPNGASPHLFCFETEIEPISMRMSGGHPQPPVQKLVATIIFAKQKCKSIPVAGTNQGHSEGFIHYGIYFSKGIVKMPGVW